MLKNLALGSGLIVVNLGIQIWAISLVIRMIRDRVEAGRFGTGSRGDMGVLSLVMLFLLLGHVLQFSTWASLFVLLGEFPDLETAFYHSTVNFTSLGYGDIVMSERYRLLGALEAANGVLMFGLTAGLVLAVMSALLRARPDFGELVALQQERRRDE